MLGLGLLLMAARATLALWLVSVVVSAASLCLVRWLGSPNWARHLVGCDLRTWCGILWSYAVPAVAHRRVHLPHALKLAYVTALVVAQAPLNAVDWLVAAAARRRHRSTAQGGCEPPVFILGHYRSGTSFLYQLMVHDPASTGITMHQTWWPHTCLTASTRWLARCCLPAQRPMDNVRYDVDDVEEHEFAVTNTCGISAYLGALYFPTARVPTFERFGLLKDLLPGQLNAFCSAFKDVVEMAHIRTGKKRVVLKNPLDTGRVRHILAMYPGAKFVYIHRNPVEVLHSTLKMWNVYVPSTALEAYDTADNVPYILHAYKGMVQAYLDERDLIPKGNLAEVSFDDLKAAPLATMARLYAALGLDGYEAGVPHFEAYLATVAEYRQNTYPRDEGLERLARESWGPMFAAFGYA